MNAVLAYIDKETGLSHSRGDYGFMSGTHLPSFLNISKGFLASSNVFGYMVTNREREFMIRPSTPEQELKEVIAFLKQDLVVSNI